MVVDEEVVPGWAVERGQAGERGVGLALPLHRPGLEDAERQARQRVVRGRLEVRQRVLPLAIAQRVDP